MNWSKIYNEICGYLEQRKLEDHSKYLKEAFVIGATGGEIFDIAITRLIELNRKGLLDGVSDKVLVIINYAKSIEHLSNDFEI